MQDFTRLRVWKAAHGLAVAVCIASTSMRGRRPAQLAAQMQRSALSIPANIAEGCGHEGAKELKRFLTIARASSSELQAQLLVVRDLDLLSGTSIEALLTQVSSVQRMLTSFQQRVAASANGGHPRANS